MKDAIKPVRLANDDSFLYIWEQLSTTKFYLGYHKGSPEDGYICSSKIVKKLILENPLDWERTIIEFGEAKKIAIKEAQILNAINAKQHAWYYNEHNGDGKFNNIGRPISNSQKEILRQCRLKEGPNIIKLEKMWKARRNSKNSLAHNIAISKSLTNRVVSIETRQKQSKNRAGSIYYNNGKKNIRLKKDQQPPIGFIKGRLNERSY